MILSVSRRTDIPALYTPWFLNRLEQGFVLVRNPMNYHQVSRVALSPDIVDCIVFWTKNPHEISDKIDLLKPYMYYFLITVNPYGVDIERNLPAKKYIIDDFRRLSDKIGKDRVIWRYDPIILTEKHSAGYHRKCFDALAERLCRYTEKCVISFLDLYKTTRRNMKSVPYLPLAERVMREIAADISRSAVKYGISVQTCCEGIDLDSIGITHGSCIDKSLIEKLTGKNLNAKKDKNQRKGCGCSASIDIGAYNTCTHGCLYCYANFNDTAVRRNAALHDPKSPLLYGNLEPDDKISERQVFSLAAKTPNCGQLSFFAK